MGIAVENDGEGFEKTSAMFGAFMGNDFVGDEDSFRKGWATIFASLPIGFLKGSEGGVTLGADGNQVESLR